ncbi:MAG: Lar family restriction alleviation protein, partial [Gammaproteobacteria bacterium]|nr:Lar family restriction alleviation protein [Gammaproteobacteria bacterium]
MKLEPCPFCGSTMLEVDRIHKKYERSTTQSWWFITCYDCPCEGVTGKTKEDAAKAWNQRHTGWVSVDERNPTKLEEYLVWREHGGFGLSFYFP